MTDVFGWTGFILALVAFLASHAIPARPSVRQRLVGLFGLPAYVTIYSAVSLVLLALLFREAAMAPYVEIWQFADWQRHVPWTLVPLAVGLGLAGIMSPNPFSLSASRHRFDPAHPGIVALVRHPVLLSLFVWSAAHIPPNGDLAHVVLFSTFAFLAAAGMAILDRRARRRMGATAWRKSIESLRGNSRMPRFRDIVLFVSGALAALLFAIAHEAIIGVPALP